MILPAQGFGRFGYIKEWDLSGFHVDGGGFRADSPTADRILFPDASPTWKPISTLDTEQTVAVDTKVGGPIKLSTSLTSPGFEMYFVDGFALRVHSTGAPYLTWREGSIEHNLPTPDAPWIVMSFSDSQPPIVFGFPERPASLKVVGKPGDWRILGPSHFRGWVKVGLPMGLQRVSATTASSLGQLARAVAKESQMWAKPAPRLLKVKVDADEDGVTARWIFDRPGALIPPAITYAPIGRYPLEVASKVRPLDFTLGEGPLQVCDEPDLVVRLPVRQVPPGRGLAEGSVVEQPIGTVSPIDLPGVVELALETLPSTRDAQTRRVAQDTLNEYLANAPYTPEANSGQLLPYNAKGEGLDLAAAQALLMQAGISSTNSTSEANSLLTSVNWRRDWWTWLPITDSDDVSRRSAALAAIAGAMCTEPERRLAAAMFQAGLSAERGYDIWRSRRVSGAAAPRRLETMLGLRSVIFRLSPPRLRPKQRDPEELFAEEMLSPLRVFSDLPVQVERKTRLILEWTPLDLKPGSIEIVGMAHLNLNPVANLAGFRIDQTQLALDLSYSPLAGVECQAAIELDPPETILPPAVACPRFREARL